MKPSRSRFIAGVAALGGALLLSSCTCSQPAEQAAVAASAADAAQEVALPAPGDFSVAVAENGYTVLAHQAGMLAVLDELQQLAGFGVSIDSDERARRLVTLRAVNVPLTGALEELLEGVPHALYYGADRILERVALGEGEDQVAETPVVHPFSRQRTRRPEAAREPRPEPTPRDHEAEQAESLAKLRSPDPAVRAEAAEWMYGDEQGIAELSNIIVSDPDRSVRVAAAEGLSGAEDEASATNALIRALGDPEPEVVIAALDAIEYVGDSSVIPELIPLLSHPSTEVRERTVEAIEWLED